MEVIRGLQLFAGWALDGSDRATRVELSLSDGTRLHATMGATRRDVVAAGANARSDPDCGWTAVVDLSRFTPGPLTVSVMAYGREAHAVQIACRSFRIITARLTGAIDLPLEGATIEGSFLVVSGWATIGPRGVARVEVTVNGQACGRARLCMPRPDVAALDRRLFGPVAGFEYRDVLPTDTSEHLDIDVDVIAFDGDRERFPRRTAQQVAKRVTPEAEEQATRLRRMTVKAVTSHPRFEAGASRSLLVFTHDLGIGGGQLYLSELLTRLAPGLQHCTVVAPYEGPLRAQLEMHGVDVVVTGRVLATDPITYEGHIRELSHFIVGCAPDVVLVNTLGPWAAADAAQRMQVPTVWSIHESFAIEHWLSAAFGHTHWHPYVRDRLIATLGGVNTLVFEAEATSQMFAPYASPAQRQVITYGVDTQAIRTHAAQFDRAGARRARAIPADAVILLSVGVVEPRKSQAALVEAFAAIAPEYPRTLLVLIGDVPGPYSEAVHELVDQSGLDQRIRLLPVSPDVWDWYALSDVIVSTSDIESLPRNLLEAMAFGVPALSTEVFGVPELLQDGRNGWLFPARDLAALRSALLDFLQRDSATRHAVAEAGRATVMKGYDSHGYAEAYAALFASLVRGRP